MPSRAARSSSWTSELLSASPRPDPGPGPDSESEGTGSPPSDEAPPARFVLFAASCARGCGGSGWGASTPAVAVPLRAAAARPLSRRARDAAAVSEFRICSETRSAQRRSASTRKPMRCSCWRSRGSRSCPAVLAAILQSTARRRRAWPAAERALPMAPRPPGSASRNGGELLLPPAGPWNDSSCGQDDEPPARRVSTAPTTAKAVAAPTTAKAVAAAAHARSRATDHEPSPASQEAATPPARCQPRQLEARPAASAASLHPTALHAAEPAARPKPAAASTAR
mmetsp:Transcript_10347/g.40243  ORF Transcript_10347/g.40243 Transcript_10347/m.40243 type:complete len:283 (+) Transcript_10347:251-1099(+)